MVRICPFGKCCQALRYAPCFVAHITNVYDTLVLLHGEVGRKHTTQGRRLGKDVNAVPICWLHCDAGSSRARKTNGRWAMAAGEVIRS